jgi:phospholipase/carboxylesterase
VREVGHGERVLVLLHGYGAPGNDLVPLATKIASETGYRVVLPVGPRASGTGRAWFDPRGQTLVPSQVAAARQALVGVLASLRAQSVERPVVGGFSQGAILSLDLALSTDEPIGGVVALSGAPLPFWPTSSSRLRAPIWMAHGRADPVLSFDEARALGERLARRGEVSFVPFDGGHEVPPTIVSGLVRFLRSR